MQQDGERESGVPPVGDPMWPPVMWGLLSTQGRAVCGCGQGPQALRNLRLRRRGCKAAGTPAPLPLGLFTKSPLPPSQTGFKVLLITFLPFPGSLRVNRRQKCSTDGPASGPQTGRPGSALPPSSPQSAES